jgi:hypothetical protein
MTVGVGKIVQLDPFQLSASVRVTGPAPFCPSGPAARPTAVQVTSDAHETPVNVAPVVPKDTAADWIDQFVPFQRSTNGKPNVVSAYPTAVHAKSELHETSSS